MPAVSEITEYSRRMILDTIQNGEFPFVPFTHVRKHIESIVRGQIPATTFTTLLDLFGEEGDAPRLNLFSSKSSPAGITVTFLFRRVEVNPKWRKIPQVTFAGILGEMVQRELVFIYLDKTH